MANVIKTILTYPLTGQSEFLIPFEYLARKFVVVTLIGVDRKELVLGTDYRFATKTTIVTNNVWGQGDGYTTLEIRRFTSATERLVDFTDGSILRAYDLNVAQLQTIHVAEEARDLTADTIGTNAQGQLDARGRRIVNLANAIDAADAVPLGQIQGINQNAWQARDEALGFRNEAEGFRNVAIDRANVATQQAAVATDRANVATQQAADALTSANRAAQMNSEASFWNSLARRWASEGTNVVVENGLYSARHYAVLAASYRDDAVASAIAASNEATRSKTEADRAETEADKLGNWNALATALESVTGTDVIWKGVQQAKSVRTVSNAGSISIESTGASPDLTPEVTFKGFRGNPGATTMRIGADNGNSQLTDSHGMYSVNSGQHYQFTIDGSNHISTLNGSTAIYMGPPANPIIHMVAGAGAGTIRMDGVIDSRGSINTSGLVASHDVEARGVVYAGGASGGKLDATGNLSGPSWGSQGLKQYIDQKPVAKGIIDVWTGVFNSNETKTLSQSIRGRVVYVTNAARPGVYHGGTICPPVGIWIMDIAGAWYQFEITDTTIKMVDFSGGAQPLSGIHIATY